jgi:hypothetical protein
MIVVVESAERIPYPLYGKDRVMVKASGELAPADTDEHFPVSLHFQVPARDASHYPVGKHLHLNIELK